MKKISNILFLYFFVFIMCMGASFAWYAWQGTDVQVNVNFAGLDPYIKYTATTITGEDGITPSDTYTGGISNDITFNKEETGAGLQLYGHVYLEINSASSEDVFKVSNLKWTLVSVTNDVETEISTGNFVGELVDNKIPAYINFPLNPNSNTTYKAYIWIDNNAPLNKDISNQNISVNIYSEASTIGSDNEGKYNELYIREIIYQNSIINSIKLYSSIYEITNYMITNTNDIPTVDSTGWISVTSTTSSTESGYIATVSNINHSMNAINNICIKNSNGDVTCKSIGNYVNITYDCITNGGTTATTYEYPGQDSNADLTKTCTKDGWTFVGWNTNSDATTKLDSYTVPDTDSILYGIYRKESITYTAYTKRNIDDIVTGDDTSASCTIDEVYNNDIQATSCNITLPDNPYTFTDWEFNGWVSSNTSTTTTSETSGSSVGSSLTLTSDINLIATWKRDYTATFYTYTNNYTDTCTAYNNDICTFTLPNITTIEGPDSSTYYGVSTSILDTTTTTTYNSTYIDYYSVYIGSWTATYTKENDNVISIGKTTDTCDAYKYYDGSSYTSSTCNVTLPDITVISGYIAFGWFDSENNRVGNPADSVAISTNVNYIAKATEKLVASDFSYDDTNTNLSCDDIQCAIDSLDINIASDFSFDSTGLSVDCSDVTCMLDELYRMVDESTNLTITLDNDDATTAGTSSIYVSYGTGIYLDSAYANEMTTSSNPITIPTKTGYAFDGYYDTTGTTQYINEDGYLTNNSTNTSFSSNITLKAKWTAIYTVSYDANGGSGAPSSQIKTHGTDLTLSSTTPTRTGYTFQGWGTSSSTSTVSYSAGESYTTDADITLYAVWKYNVSYPLDTTDGKTIDTINSEGLITITGTSSNSSYDWSIDSTYGFRSNNNGVASSTGSSTIVFTPPVAATLTFDYGVSSESSYDKLTIKLTGSNSSSVTIASAISGTTTGSANRALTAGVTYTLTLSYAKDSSVDKNNDLGYIKNLKIVG